jgi:isoquinoline 1-oxidoreductase alpha subunit
MAVDIALNGKAVRLDTPPDTPLLWALRDELNLVGTKFGCGAGLCGACTVLVGGRAVRSCQTSVADVAGKAILTIEGVEGAIAKAVMDAWIAAQAPQCGYCQPGFIMAATGAIMNKPDASADDILSGLTNICRCGSYDAIRSAVGAAIASLNAGGKKSGETVR